MEGVFDTGYLKGIECFVAEGSLLIWSCTEIHITRKGALKGLGAERLRPGWEEVSCLVGWLSLPVAYGPSIP